VLKRKMPVYVLGKPNLRLKKKYEFDRQIGEPGQYGVAHVAKKRLEDGSEKTVVVKTISKGRFFRGSLKYLRRAFGNLRNEIKIMKETKHKNIINFEDAFEDKDNLYIAMEACFGGELFDRIQQVQEKRGFSELEASLILKQIFEGLAYLHSEVKVAHCDLKPDNFLFKDKKEDSEVKIIDFGMAKFLKNEFYRDLCGTPYYIAPEVWEGKYASACDMWSMGVITFIMLYGYPPFHGQVPGKGQSDERIKQQIQKGFTPIVKEGFGQHFPARPKRSEASRKFIAKLLVSDPGTCKSYYDTH